MAPVPRALEQVGSSISSAAMPPRLSVSSRLPPKSCVSGPATTWTGVKIGKNAPSSTAFCAAFIAKSATMYWIMGAREPRVT